MVYESMRNIRLAVVLAALLFGTELTHGAALSPQAPDTTAASVGGLSEAQRLEEQAVRLGKARIFDQAIPIAQRALHLREAALGPEHLAVAASLDLIAALFSARGAYHLAALTYQRALKIRETSLGPNHLDVATSLYDLAVALGKRSAFAQAEVLHMRALKIRESALGSTNPYVAQSLNKLAISYGHHGAYTRAEAYFQRALKISEVTPGTGSPLHGDVLHNLGALYLSTGVCGTAERLLRRALDIRVAALGSTHPDVADSLRSLAELYARHGIFPLAEPMARRAIQIYEASRGPEHPDIVNAVNTLGFVYYVRRDYSRAQRLHQRALAMAEAAPELDPRLVGVLLNNIAWLHLVSGSDEQAVPYLWRALEIEESEFASATGSLSERRVAELLTNNDITTMALLAARRPNASVNTRWLAMTTALLRKGRVSSEIGQSMQAVAKMINDPVVRQDVHQQTREFRSLQKQIANFSNPSSTPIKSPGSLQPLLDRRDDLEQQIFLVTSPPQRWQPFRPSEAKRLLSDVARVLPTDGVLLEIVRLNIEPSNKSPRYNYIALLLFPNETVNVMDLGSSVEIDEAADALRRSLSQPSADLAVTRRAAVEFYHLVMAPLLPLLGGRTRVLLSPDGALNRIPFAALHDGDDWLVGRFQFSYLIAPTHLLYPQAVERPSPSVVVFADPDFSFSLTAQVADNLVLRDSRGLVTSGGPSVMQTSLPGTRREAEGIKRIWPHANLFLGNAAHTAALLNVQAPDILHVATHGVFESGSTPALARSALLLARAPKQRADSEIESKDGRVSALEISGMNLRGTRLVVLSACDTGLGDLKPQDGVVGLRRSFFIAGAETVVTSLWQVDDWEAQRLMLDYYARLAHGEGRAAAMDHAALALKREKPHPFYWAPFIVIGRSEPLSSVARSVQQHRNLAPRFGVPFHQVNDEEFLNLPDGKCLIGCTRSTSGERMFRVRVGASLGSIRLSSWRRRETVQGIITTDDDE